MHLTVLNSIPASEGSRGHTHNDLSENWLRSVALIRILRQPLSLVSALGGAALLPRHVEQHKCGVDVFWTIGHLFSLFLNSHVSRIMGWVIRNIGYASGPPIGGHLFHLCRAKYIEECTLLFILPRQAHCGRGTVSLSVITPVIAGPDGRTGMC